MPFPLPPNEIQRLVELRSYDLLDTAPEEALDEIVNLAAEVCDVPIAVISVIDETRQWFKAKLGLEAVQTPRDLAFCSHAICQRGLLVVPDATEDERFADNPLVTGEPGIRFYAGAPLLTPSGNALGTLCVVDQKPRDITPAQRKILAVLSRQVVTQLELKRNLAQRKKAEQELARAHAELEVRVRERTEELNVAYQHARAEAAERMRSEQALQHRNDQLLRFEAALLKLATTRHAELSGALRHVIEIAAHTLGVHNVSVWLFNEGRDALRCVDVYRLTPEFATGHLPAENEFLQVDCPRLFAELKKNLPLVVPDFETSESTSGLRQSWPQAEDIKSLLAVPIRLRGEMIGTLLLGQSDVSRSWDRTEMEFAGSLTSVIALALEADERQRVEAALHESRSRLDLTVEAARIGLWKRNLQNDNVWFSDEWKRQLGYEPDEIPNTFDEWLRRIHPDDLERGYQLLDYNIAGVLPEFELEYRLQHRDGSWVWMLNRARVDFDKNGQPLRILGCHIDVTARHRLEEQLHALAAHLDQVREDERKGLARELHDELGQMLTALRMDVAWLNKAFTERKESAMQKLPQRLGGMKELIDQAISTVQRIASDLRPGMLDELGLVAALEWQAKEFQERSGITTSFTSSVEEASLEPARALTFYRVLQEALTNVARHAEASEVRVTFENASDRYSLEICDNGRGMPEGALSAANSLGLVGMRERALVLGGEVIFSQTPGSGTTVTVSLPLTAAVHTPVASAAFRTA